MPCFAEIQIWNAPVKLLIHCKSQNIFYTARRSKTQWVPSLMAGHCNSDAQNSQGNQQEYVASVATPWYFEGNDIYRRK